ncbi:MAG: V-type ATPase subunit [Clostridiales bacterium]|jgi:V/A-type H+-transporting ATPase subunit C|nr:V-type ATPase subunit [Clostridiales bacterium]
MRTEKPKEYPYAVGRLRVIEKGMLDGAAIARAAECASADEAFRLLAEAGYDVSGGNADAAASAEYAKLTALIRSLIPDERRVLSVLFGRNDYHNAKLRVKSRVAGGGAGYELPGGFADEEALDGAEREASDAYARSGDPRVIDIALDRAALGRMAEDAAATGDSFLTEYARIVVDCANISAFTRTDLWAGFAAAFAPGGELPLSFFKSAFQSDNKARALAPTHYASLVSGAAGDLDRARDALLIRLAKSVKAETISFRPVAAYAIGKEIEIRNVRLALLAPVAKIAAEAVKGALREAYV